MKNKIEDSVTKLSFNIEQNTMYIEIKNNINVITDIIQQLPADQLPEARNLIEFCLKKLQTKEFRLESEITARYFRSIRNDIKNRSYEAIQDEEFLKALINDVIKDPSAMYLFSSWSISPASLYWLYKEIGQGPTTSILEFGSGLSTVVAAKALQGKSHSNITSIESDIEHLKRVAWVLDQLGLSENVNLVHAPITKEQGISWYNRKIVNDALSNNIFDFAIIDGPPTSTGLNARTPAANMIKKHVRLGGQVLIDDVDRRDESELLSHFTASSDWSPRFTPIFNRPIAVFRRETGNRLNMDPKILTSIHKLKVETNEGYSIYKTKYFEYHYNLVQKKNNDRLFVIFHGAKDRNRYFAPFFERLSWDQYFPGSVLYISDPALHLHDKLRLGWYAGDKNEYCMNIISEIVDNISSFLGIRQIYSFGSSGGGFASLSLGAILDSCHPIAVNPQTNIFAYYQGHFNEYINCCFDGISRLELENAYSVRFNMIDRYKNDNHKGYTLLQNRLDEFHYSRHYSPLLDLGGGHTFSINEQSEIFGKRTIHLYDDKKGHGPEPRALFDQLMLNITQN